ncbi:MAG: glutamate-1-semialdehyde 2,1-aminomutase [Actinomycetota bacterium]|nr:glutamate-1-semialdehyde 2,1-aminomutase [Actinomycetota bacterium]
METKRSKELFEEAVKLIAGGVNSPVRAFKAVGGEPLFISHGKGSKIYDVDGNEFIDYVSSYGPLILGHAHPAVLAAIAETAQRGLTFGAPTELEVEMARLITSAMPSLERLRMVSSGTEAVMSAIRLARGFTGRSKVIKFDGCYHGHSDGMLAAAGSGVATLSIAGCPGVTKGAAEDTIALDYNDLEAVRGTIAKWGGEIAAVIVEPVAANMGLVLPEPGFLEGLRKLTQESGIPLIFDEVITGFRLGLSGAQGLYGIEPDLTCLGKIIGGGLPVGAFGGRAEVMEHLAPIGPVYQAGTLSGNPVSLSTGLMTLKILADNAIYSQLDERSVKLSAGIEAGAKKAGIKVFCSQIASMSTVFFTEGPVTDYSSAKRSNLGAFASFFRSMLERGIYLAPSQFEASFISASHSDEDIEKTVRAAEESFLEML